MCNNIVGYKHLTPAPRHICAEQFRNVQFLINEWTLAQTLTTDLIPNPKPNWP